MAGTLERLGLLMCMRKPFVAIGLLLGLCATAGVSPAAAPGNLSGSLIGFVSDPAGVPQMGAAVLLFNQYEKLVERAITNEKGAFGFDSLAPGVYSIRVSLASFVPALKQNVSIQPGMRSFLSINLASVLSSIELIYLAPGPAAIMSDDWKWVLRTAVTTRPVLRIIPGIDISDPSRKARPESSVFSDTHGLVRVSAGEGGTLAAAGNQPDLGTAFALATSLFGANQLEFSGNVGYASSNGIPTAGFRTGFRRGGDRGMSPEVNLTMRQVFLPARTGTALLAQGGAPVLRTMSVSTVDRRQITDDVRLEYGASMESVAFLERLNYLSPFARLTYSLGHLGILGFAYSSGIPPLELLGAPGPEDPETGLQQDLTVLSLFPRVSLLGRRARVQRTENFEIGYTKVSGGRTYSVGAFREVVSNAALMMAAPAGFYGGTDLLPDLSSNSSIFNVGGFQSVGYMAAVSQALEAGLTLTLGLGSGGALRAERHSLHSANPDELRDLIREGRRHWVLARFSGTAPWTGTRFAAGYQWTDYRTLNPGHFYLTQRIQPEGGLNVFLRQPVPSPGVFAGRLEATAELRNLLAQGYLPLSTADGRKLYLIQTPRSVRGGLSFIF